MKYTRYIFRNLQTGQQKIRKQRLTSSVLNNDLWCFNDHFFILYNSCSYDIQLFIVTHVVMTYCLSLYHMLVWHTACFCHIYCNAILIVGAWHVIIWCLLIWHIISWHSAYFVTYFAMPYCLWKHNMLRHSASCSKISCYDIVCCCDIVKPQNLCVVRLFTSPPL
jgi:hypothetical protein